MKLRADNLRKVYKTRFGENLVLDGISFELKMGERLGILGRNGAGKSTLVRLLSGAERPTSGRVDSDMSISWPIAFGGAFQPNLTGLDNIRFISRIYGQDAQKNIAFVEDFAELGSYLKEEVRFYSSGMRARLAFAISMIIEFDCFLIDEIAAVGDARFHERCNRELFGNRADRAMVIISHDASYLRDHCNRFAVLHEGALAQFADFDEAYADFRLKIGLDAAARSSPVAQTQSRAELVEVTHEAAVRDDAFRILVQQADWYRDAGNWEAAEVEYTAALELYPYQRSYWVQKGHCAKELGDYVRAEIAYRSAIALGEPKADVCEHLQFVMDRQRLHFGIETVPSYQSLPAHQQAPAAPDVAVFARLLWGQAELPADDRLRLIRDHTSCDALAAAMLKDSRFSKRYSLTFGDPMPDPAATHAVTLTCSQLDQETKRALVDEVRTTADPWPLLREAGAFQAWPLASSMIHEKVSI